VTLELGIALATSDDWYICFNPEETDTREVPSDIRGLDRIQYISFSELEDRLTVLLDQWYPRATRTTVEDYFARARGDVLNLIKQNPGLKVTDIADIIGMNLSMVKVVTAQLVSDQDVKIEGKTRGAKYFPVERKTRRTRFPKS
jgi:hypothetical protein